MGVPLSARRWRDGMAQAARAVHFRPAVSRVQEEAGGKCQPRWTDGFGWSRCRLPGLAPTLQRQVSDQQHGDHYEGKQGDHGI